ncbi:MAG: 4-alpha-glucanotransferase [Treponema sp.]|jgi:4-alpha-glucanotransferase|nr:4-alpha-glucanotransferase [Treponema sp.]
MAQTNEKTDKARLLGTVVPVGALRSEGSAVGEFADLAEFGRLCVKMGIGLIQILPVNDTGYQSSPYFALTAFALHPLYLRLSDLKEAAGCEDKIAALNAAFAKETRFPYEEVLRAKMALLRGIYEDNRKKIESAAKPGGSLAKWIAANPWVREYAVFRTLKEANEERSWKEWPDHQQISEKELAARWSDPALWGAHLFWAWVQQALDAQFGAAARALSDLGLILEGDLPILMNEDSHDVWAHPAYFDQTLSAGAPPDIYSPDGQNWGFPIYNWKALAKDDYSWWRARLAAAAKYYQAYRIDHVLGFFRIWASSRADAAATLGRFVPSTPITKADLAALGFDEARVHWLSRPHIPTGEVWDAIRANWKGPSNEAEAAEAAGRVFSTALERIGSEELWLFKESIKGDKDITALGLQAGAQAYLLGAWGNRLFVEYEKGLYFPVWFYRNSRAYASLSEDERRRLEAFIAERAKDSEKIWEAQGKKLLSMLCDSSAMLPCAEDLGAVPECVPRVLSKLHILGLRVVRWHRDWEAPGEPYYPFSAYPELSVCTPAVHDSSTLREWWNKEADQTLFAGFIGVPSLPRVYNPGVARTILFKIASAASRFRVFQIQDLLHLSPRWYAEDAASERINVPGTNTPFNWTYRLPAPIADIAKDSELAAAVRELAEVKAAKEPKAKKAEK